MEHPLTDSKIKRASPCSRFTLFSIIATAIILIAGLYPYPEVSEEIVIFIGRFHPLVVHMPIGFIAAVVILQLVARFSQSNLRIGIGTLLWFSMITAILSTIIGTLLAIPGGYDAELLLKHRQLGLGTSIATIWMLCAHRSKRRGSGLFYSLSLLFGMGLLGATGHFGGSLTHGDDYLTAYLPEALGGKTQAEPIDPGTPEDAALYDRVIQPILDAKCVACHNDTKSKGELRMDSFEALLIGGKKGPTLIENNAAESLMIERAQLPLDHKEHMPPEGKVQLSEAELEAISWWIDQGAPERMSLDTDLPSDESIALMETALGFVIAEPMTPMLPWQAAVEASAPLHHLPQLRIQRVALDSPALDVFFEPTTDSIDALVAQLAPIKANITLLDIGNTTFSDATLKEIGTFSNLEQLRLNNTSVTDDGIQHLANLRQLEKLSLYGTPISDAALQPLKKLPKLRQVITWNTDVSYEAAEDFKTEMVNANKQRKLQDEINALQSRLNSMEVNVVGPVKKIIDPFERSVELFNEDAKKYGDPLAAQATVTVSSSSQFDPPEGLKLLVQEQGNELPFSFHTQQQKQPWVRFSYDQQITLNAISIKNRRDIPERAAGLTLQSSNQDLADCSVHITNSDNTQLTEYPLGKSLRGRYVTMRLAGGSLNPGGTELLLGKGSDKAGKTAVSLLGKPARATASVEFSEGYAVDHLYDGTVTIETVGTSTGLGKDYAGRGLGPHVVVYDMGATVTFDRVFYAQRTIKGQDHVDRIEFWVSDTDPGAASALATVLDGNDWQDVWTSTQVKADWNIDLTRVKMAKRQAKHFRLMIPGDSATLHLQQVLLWGKILPPTSSIAAFDKDKAKFGERITPHAEVTVSSTSQHDPLDGLQALIQNEDNGLVFAFHTQNEDHPWVRFNYEHAITLTGLNLVNRSDAPERAQGISLESSQDGTEWQPLWTPTTTEPFWNIDLTQIPAVKRHAKYFRLIIKTPATLNLGQVRMWGKEEAPAASIALFNHEKDTYGELVSDRAKVSVSSTSQFDLPDGLHAFTQIEDNGLPFAFHTQHENQPWVQCSYEQPITLNALSIRNRGNLHGRADGLALQRSSNGTDWELVWKSTRIAANWHIDLTHLPAEQRQAPHFRLILLKEGLSMLHLGQLRMWGTGLGPRVANPVTAATTGQGEWTYEVVPDWGHVPGHDHIGSTHGGIVIDQSGKVYVSTDGPNGMIVYHPDGSFIKTFGENSRHYHGLNIYQEDGQEYIYAAGMNHVAKFDLNGNVILKIEGAKQESANSWAKATAVAVAPNGDIFIADGYGSSVIFKYDKTGTFIKQFGLRGREEGQFITSHGLTIDARDPSNPLLMVCDRENLRLQHFDLDGNFVNVAINGLRRPCAAAIWKDYVLVAELAGRAVILDKDNQIISVLGDNPDTTQRANFKVPPEQWQDGVFTAPHGCSFDHEGNVYIEDWNKWGRITKLVRKH
jgi:uncharacterized membrane protein